jgi:alpha-tubulin suppressor-like RCC1 family protein
MKTAIRDVGMLCALMAALTGCSSPPSTVVGAHGDPSGGSAGDELGSASFELTVVPAGAQCLVLNAVTSANMTVSKQFALTAGSSSSNIAFGTLPNGPTSFSGYAYNVACASIGTNSPTWQSDPILITVQSGAVVSAALTFRPVNPVNASVSFVPNLLGLAAGAMSTVVATDGAPMHWGWINNSTPSPQKVPGLSDATAVTAGYYHACALRADGTVWCWGYNTAGQVGPGVPIGGSAMTAVQVPLTGAMTMIAAGGFHTCAYRANPVGIFCWGSNSNGQLGNNSTVTSATPVAVSTSYYPLRHLSAGYQHTIAATNDGHLLVWGANANGQLGDGTKTDRLTPVYVYSPSTVVQVAGGAAHSCGLRADGIAVCWGYNGYGELGDATTVEHLTPAPIAAVIPGPLKQIVTGNYHTCARTTDGRVFCWGYNFDGEVGDLTTVTRTTPTAVDLGGATATTLAAGNYHSCALLSTTGLACWGTNQNGQIGDGTTNFAFGPVKVVF